MRGFYNITERIRLQLAADEFVNTVTYGDIFRVDLKKQTLFPLSHIVVNNATMENNVWRYNISIMAMDIVDISKEAVTQTAQGIFRGNDNEQDVLNTQFAVLNRLLEVLRSGDIRNELYQLDGNPNLEPFTERFENFLAGWVATFDVLIPNDMTSCDATVTPSVICEDATAITTDSEGNQLYSNSISSGGTETQVIQDSTAVLKNTLGATISTTPILAEGSEDIIAPNSTYLVEYQNGTDIQSGSIVSGGSVTVIVPNPIVCADTTIEVNGTIEGTVVAGSTVDVQLSDSGGVVVPTSVTQVGNDFQIVLADAPIAVTRSTATLMKTGQTASYGDYDDGFYRLGRNTDFFTLDAIPVHINGAATLNTTTNRFTDILGGQTYTNNIMLDWSTWNGATLKGWVRATNGGNVNWNTARLGAAGVSIGVFSTNWALPNITELQSLSYYGVASGSTLNYAPLIAADASFANVATLIWCGTTVPTGTTNSYAMIQGAFGIYAKTSTARWMACRTFSLSTSNVLS